MKLLKTFLISLGLFFVLVGLFLWIFALSRRTFSNLENWDGKFHLGTIIEVSVPIVAGIVLLVIARKIKRKDSN
jgi:hypothetical protein